MRGMRGRSLVVAGLSAGAGVLLLVACVGSDTDPVSSSSSSSGSSGSSGASGSSSGASGSSSSGSSGASGTSGGDATTDSSTQPDGGSDSGPVGDADPPCTLSLEDNFGLTHCINAASGTGPNCSEAQVCCAGGGGRTCEPIGTTPCNDPWTCESAGSCPTSGNVCCMTLALGGAPFAQCAKVNAKQSVCKTPAQGCGSDVQLCEPSNPKCPNGGKCRLIEVNTNPAIAAAAKIVVGACFPP